MAEAKAKKMSMSFDPATGTLKFAFPGLDPLSYVLSDFPEAVQAFWTGFGMKTAGRNASIGSDEDGSVGTPESMRARVAAKFDQWRQGILRATRTGEERAGIPLVLLEAAAIYRRMKAALEAGGDADDWRNYPGQSPEELRAEFEALADVVTNPEEVEAARAKALAEGEDEETANEIAEKAATTRLTILKSKTVFKYALAAAKAERETAKKAALKAKMLAEASEG